MTRRTIQQTLEVAFRMKLPKRDFFLLRFSTAVPTRETTSLIANHPKRRISRAAIRLAVIVSPRCVSQFAI